MSKTYLVQPHLGEKIQWERARRAAFVQNVLATFTQRPAALLPFEEVRQKLQLSNTHYLGLQEVALDHIVGSLDRYRDFTRAFFPRLEHLEDRWRRIDWLMTSGSGLPPIELYKVGQVYFVRDGNHRVSVARHRNLPGIEAYVWEYMTDVPLEPDTDIDELLCKAAHAAFVERTHIDRLCPDLDIKLTQPDGYEEVLREIEAFQHVLSRIDEREVPFDEALVLWGEMRYTPIVDIIRERHVLQEFPGRSEADLYLWLCRNQKELEARYQGRVLMEESADDLAKRFSETPLPVRQVRRAVNWMAGAAAHWAAAGWRALRQRLRRL